MTATNATERAADYRIAAESCRKDAKALLARYGDGVRPSWVSTDLTIAFDQARRYETLAKEEEAKAKPAYDSGYHPDNLFNGGDFL